MWTSQYAVAAFLPGPVSVVLYGNAFRNLMPGNGIEITNYVNGPIRIIEGRDIAQLGGFLPPAAANRLTVRLDVADNIYAEILSVTAGTPPALNRYIARGVAIGIYRYGEPLFEGLIDSYYLESDSESQTDTMVITALHPLYLLTSRAIDESLIVNKNRADYIAAIAAKYGYGIGVDVQGADSVHDWATLPGYIEIVKALKAVDEWGLLYGKTDTDLGYIPDMASLTGNASYNVAERVDDALHGAVNYVSKIDLLAENLDAYNCVRFKVYTVVKSWG